MLRQQHGTAVRREKNSRRRRRKKPRSGKGFNWIREKVLLECADSRFAKPRNFTKGFKFACANLLFFALIQGLQNLESPCKGFNCCGAKMSLRWADSRFAEPRCSLQRERVATFCIVQKVTKKHTRTCKKLPVASFCASETAETGRIANGCEQGDHVSRRRRSPATHDSKLCRK